MTTEPAHWRAPRFRTALKRLRVGAMLATLRRRRHVPVQAWRAGRLHAADQRAGRIPPPAPRRRDVRGVVCIPAGPGELHHVLDTARSVLASDPDLHIIIVEDATTDVREALVRAELPMVDVLRRRLPSGGPPRMFSVWRDGVARALETVRFEWLLKLDADALVCGPQLGAEISRRLDALPPEIGVAGSYRVRADGEPEDAEWHRWTLRAEARYDAMLADALGRAEANGLRIGDAVQGGAHVLTADAARRLCDDGWLDWSPRWWSRVNDDAAMTVFCSAAGFAPASIGGPDGIFAIKLRGLPLDLRELADGPWMVAHSVRRGLHGEDEATVRAFFAAQRRGW